MFCWCVISKYGFNQAIFPCIISEIFFQAILSDHKQEWFYSGNINLCNACASWARMSLFRQVSPM